MSWTEITRIKYRRDGLRYASDTTDEEWALIEPHMPAKFRVGRPRETKMRAVLDAIFYIIETGCQWRMLPKDFPPFTTVQGYFYQWRDDGRWESINHHLLMQVSALARKRRAALVFRRSASMKSIRRPCLSTARNRYFHLPPT